MKILNINYGHNKKLMEACRALNDYAVLVDAIRENQKAGMTLDEAVDAAIDDTLDDSLLKKFLLGHRAEVKGMYLTEYDEEKERIRTLREGREEGHEEGHEEGVKDTNRRVASDMLREKMPLSLIAKISRLTESEILTIADSLGISPA